MKGKIIRYQKERKLLIERKNPRDLIKKNYHQRIKINVDNTSSFGISKESTK